LVIDRWCTGKPASFVRTKHGRPPTSGLRLPKKKFVSSCDATVGSASIRCPDRRKSSSSSADAATGLVALERIGFRSLEGVDLSSGLAERYRGSAQLYVGDCRQLRFEADSKDLVVIQGGLHHLPLLPDDVERVFDEINRILRPTGRVAIVEPWLTPFLRVVHTAYASRALRRLWPKLDALASMNEREEVTYQAWLAQPRLIRRLLVESFVSERQFERFGKLLFLGRPRKGEAAE